MMLFEQTVKERFFRRTPHLYELQGLQIAQRSTQRTLLHPYASGPCAFRDAIPHHAFYGRQLDLARTVKHQQQSATDHVATRRWPASTARLHRAAATASSGLAQDDLRHALSLQLSAQAIRRAQSQSRTFAGN